MDARGRCVSPNADSVESLVSQSGTHSPIPTGEDGCFHSTSNVPERPVHIAYFLSQFPNLTTTFTFNEMESLRRLGIQITAVSVRAAGDGKLAADSHVGAFQENCVYAPLHSLAVWWHFILAWCRTPRLMLRSVCLVLWEANPNPYAILKCFLALLKAPFLAKQLLKRGVTHFHANFATLPATAAMFGSRLTGIPFSYKYHAFDIYARSWRLTNCLERAKIHDASFVTTAHRHGKHYLSSKFGRQVSEKLKVEYIGIDTNEFRPHRESTRSCTNFLAVSQLFEKKGIRYLVEACGLLRNIVFPFNCIIVGDGPLLGPLRQLTRDFDLDSRVQFTGATSHAQVKQYLESTDVFVLPCIVAKDGDRDGIPTALIEAMACGIPVITTPIAGIPELVINERTGMLVEPKNADQLSDMMLSVASDHKLRQRLGHAAREYVEQHFDTMLNARRMAALFRSESAASDNCGMKRGIKS